jgi:Mor family transcriptional regulator
LKPEQEQKICDRYLTGESTVKLAQAFMTTATLIRSILRRNGIELRSNSAAQGGLDPKQEAEVCRRYEEGENCRELEKAFGVCDTTIQNILKRNGIRRRGVGEARSGLKPEQDIDICCLYLAGQSAYELGNAFDVSPTHICNVLRRNGIERRASGIEFGDSVQHIFDGTGRHTHARECSFYLFELALYSATHCKPGIAFDVDARVDDEYGELVLELWFATRAEAYFLEQAVLDATRGSASCPDDLRDWAGASEVRAMPASDMLPIVLRLADELEELGMWEFAARYVPMTAAQRAQCQQRALEAIAA